MTKPNILLLFADQMRFDCLGAVNSAIKTPNLDKLAARGLLAERAYSPAAVCLPCRASLITGVYPSTHGASYNLASLPETGGPFIAEDLGKAGYYTHIVGKSHFTSCHDPTSKESDPFIHNREYYRSWFGPWYGFERADIAIGHTVEKHACGMHYGAWLEDQGVDLEKYFGNHGYEDFGAWDLPEEYSNSAWTALTTIEGIDRARDRDQPFFIWANFQDPHNPCVVPEPWASMYDPNEIPDFGFKPGEPECFADKPPFYQEIIDQPGGYACTPTDPELPGAGNVSALPYSKEDVQKNAACYYGMVSLMDKYIGKIIDHLEAIGEFENTLIVFSADHGDLMGDHGYWWKSLVAYEESIRVPFIVSHPKTIPAGTRSSALNNLIDLYPTFCSYAGLLPPLHCEGVDQSATWADPSKTTRTDTIIEERPGPTNYNQRILVESDWKCVFYAGRDYGELYHTAEDFYQVRNLWDAPEHQERKQRMIYRILSHEMNKRRPEFGEKIMNQHRNGVSVGIPEAW